MVHNVKAMETVWVKLLDKEGKLPFKTVAVSNFNNVMQIQNANKTFILSWTAINNHVFNNHITINNCKILEIVFNQVFATFMDNPVIQDNLHALSEPMVAIAQPITTITVTKMTTKTMKIMVHLHALVMEIPLINH